MYLARIICSEEFTGVGDTVEEAVHAAIEDYVTSYGDYVNKEPIDVFEIKRRGLYHYTPRLEWEK